MPDLDPLEALRHVRTLAKVAADSDNIDDVQKMLKEILNVVDKALPKKPRDE